MTEMIMHHLLFLVDVNGQKGPNKWGYDLFKLSFVKEKNKQYRLMPSGCDVTEKGGTTSADMLKNMQHLNNPIESLSKIVYNILRAEN